MDFFWLFWLLSLLGEVDISITYNVEVLEHRRFSTEVGRLFGYKVVQFNSSIGQRVLITDPGSNMLQACDVISKECNNVTLPNEDSTLHLGLTLEVEPLSSRCLVCGFEDPHDCSKTLYTKGACYTVDSNLMASEKITPGYQECQKAEVDLCFLFDDSHSVGDPEFNIIRNFVLGAIQNLKNSSLNFAVVQFATKAKTIFNFTEYKNGEAEERMIKTKHKGGGTNLFQAINFTLNEIFTPQAGAREKAKKILLLLTDGEYNDKNLGVTEAADRQEVTRYIIAVGKNYNFNNVKGMASNPPENHTHHIQEYSGLAGFFKELQTKILAIEGVAQGSSFTLEMSSAGLSAALAQDRVILGDPGIYSWSGGILDISGQERLIYTSTQEEDMNRYLGYSVKLLQTVGGLFLMVGSPRHRYVGLVTVLQEDADKRTWKNIDSIQGKQVGSYFGAEISVSDVDQDGVTDLVLISAPHHYESKWSGQVSVCRFTKLKLKCKATLHGEPGHLQSQFGAAVSTLGDLDGDRFTEVAVGAPYEMDGRGALYIYKGGPRGLSAIYSQRLLSPPGILGFGLSIHGVLDMTADGLIDVIVGSWGHVTLHRSRPLLQVTVSVTSNQKYMVVSSLEATGCDTELTLEACVIAEILTPRYNGSLSMSVRYSLVLDSSKPESRMIFRNNQREINETVEIQRPGPRCDHYTISLQDCRLRDVSEVQVSLTAFPHQEESFWLLAPSSNLNASDLISFQMCEEGKMCEPDMSIKLSHSHLVVQDSASFSMFLSLHNISMRAHHTSLSARIPDGLRFRKANVTKASHWISLLCGDFREQMLTCNISHPFLKRGVWANLQIVFSIVPNVSWTDHILMAINVTSESNGNITVSSAEDEVPVLYPIHVISRSLEDSTKHIPFTSQKQNATAAHRYQIQNLGFDPVSIDLTVSVSSYVAQSDGVSWDFIISSSKDSGVICSEHDESAANQTQSLKTRTIVNQTWHCAMDGSAEMTVMITGLLKPMDTWKEERSVSVRSAVLIRYNELRYHSDMGGTFHTAQVVTQVELLVPLEYTVYIVGGTVGGLVMMVLISFLLYKCGFFRRYKDRMMDELPPNETKELALLHN